MGDASSVLVTTIRTRNLLRRVEDFLKDLPAGNVEAQKLRAQCADTRKSCERDLEMVGEHVAFERKEAR